MEIKSNIDPSNYEVGVLIARMQVHDLHDGHLELINHIVSRHKKVILFLGIPTIENSKRNPLDYATRESMIKEKFPTLVIMPIRDQRSNEQWSKKLDDLIPLAFGRKSTLLYGSRDSFIPYYQGRYETIELLSSSGIGVSGSEVRDLVAKEIISSKDFRAGIIYGTYAKRDVTFPTVDVVAYNNEGQILMAKKPNEDMWRFIGGFVDVGDKNYEDAALREFKEETGGNCIVNSPKYILSQKVDDWRYKKELDGIMTTLYLVQHGFGMAKASDDIAEVKWIDIKTFSNYDGIRSKVMIEHRDMMTKFIDLVYSKNLIPNIGERLMEREGNITYLIE